MTSPTPWHDQINKHTVVQPACLAGTSNGLLPGSVLVVVRNGRGERCGLLCPPAARAFTAMVAAALPDGVVLDISDSYRTLASQQTLWDTRYDHTDHGLGSRTCGGDKRYLKPHCATCACPGTSKHGDALAVDTKNQTPETGLTWLEAHAHEFGFEWEVPSEVWHLHYWPGDNIPQAVLDFEAHHNPTTTKDEDMKIIGITSGDDAGKWFLVGETTFRFIDNDALKATLNTVYGPEVKIDGAAWGYIKKPLKPV